jgi:GTP diphosphokinase / guanosine-3',5'-bis(diphosphate) 3'-diphosphatase
MTFKPTKTIQKTGAEEFKKWLSFLICIDESERNTELISHYFFNKFSKSPELFYQFVIFFENQLYSCKETNLKKELAGKYLKIISQLCERFGLFGEKLILDDLCFKITDAERYRKIDKILKNYKNQSEKLVNEISRILKNLLKTKGYTCEIKGRYKNIYSVSKKLQKKPQENALKLNDIFAFRIIVNNNSTEQCFEILDLLHEQFYPVVKYFKDYITIPKINGYQSLHTGLANVIPKLDLPVEVQIRTKTMDDFAEKGLASHWIYAKTKESKLITEKEQKLIDHFSHLSDNDNTEKMIYFISYKGDIFKLEKGASIIDFAYHIHTGIGNKTESAVVNDKPQEVNYKIQECDKIKIITSSENRVNSDWLNFTSDKHTRKKIYENIIS